MKSCDVFAGIAGIALGFENAGVETVALVEKDSECQNLLKLRFPNAKIIGDVHDATKENIPTVDILTGGFPCQDVSVAGKRKGLAGERSGLWYEFHRLIRELKPNWVVIENVPGLISSNGGRDFATVIGGITGVIPDVPDKGFRNAGFARGYTGYAVAWRVLDSQFFGVAQRRRRVFIVAGFGGRSPAEVLFESEIGTWHSEKSRKKIEGTPRAFGIQPAQTSANGKGWQEELTHALSQSQLAVYAPHSHYVYSDDGTVNTIQSRQNKQDGAMPIVIKKEFWDGSQKSDSLDRSSIGKGQMMPERRRFPVVNIHHASRRDSVRTQKEDISPTVEKFWGTGGNNVPFIETNVLAFSGEGYGQDVHEELSGALLHGGSLPEHHKSSRRQSVLVDDLLRRLTPIECERLQGFPDGWTAVKGNRKQRVKDEDSINYLIWQHGLSYGYYPDAEVARLIASDSTRYRQLGNAVTVNVAEWIAKRIVAEEERANM